MWVRIEDRADPQNMTTDEIVDEGGAICAETDFITKQVDNTQNALDARIQRRASFGLQSSRGASSHEVLAYMQNEQAISELETRMKMMRSNLIRLDERLDDLDREYSTRLRKEQDVTYGGLSGETLF